MKRKRTITIEIERAVTWAQQERTIVFRCAACGAENAHTAPAATGGNCGATATERLGAKSAKQKGEFSDE